MCVYSDTDTSDFFTLTFARSTSSGTWQWLRLRWDSVLTTTVLQFLTPLRDVRLLQTVDRWQKTPRVVPRHPQTLKRVSKESTGLFAPGLLLASWGGSQTSRLLTSSLSLGVPVPHVYARRVDPSALTFSLSSHRHSYVSLLFRVFPSWILQKGNLNQTRESSRFGFEQRFVWSKSVLTTRISVYYNSTLKYHTCESPLITTVH